MDFAALGEKATVGSNRPIYPNRHCQADADVFAYDCCNLERTAQEDFEELKKYITDVRTKTGSSHIFLHLTMGLKGGRFEMATIKPYQENRSNRDPAVSKRVWELRYLMAGYKTENVTPVVWTHQEADDGMAQYQLARIAETGDEKSSVIYSIDKDLWMVYGMHMDVNSEEVYFVDGYGTTQYKEVGNVKPKLIGRGTSWFWHQMIMGDKADNIPGLPKLKGVLAERYIPLKKPNPNRTDLACGEAKAYAMLKGVTSDKEACNRVREAYFLYYGHHGDERLFEQAFLLWMRRVDDELDVLDYLEKQCGLSYQLTSQQTEALKRFMSLRQAQTEQEQTNESSENT